MLKFFFKVRYKHYHQESEDNSQNVKIKYLTQDFYPEDIKHSHNSATKRKIPNLKMGEGFK